MFSEIPRDRSPAEEKGSIRGLVNCSAWQSTWTRSRFLQFTALLRDVDALLHDANASYVIADSTALGFARHNASFIPWDDDIDIVVPSDKDLKAIALHAKDHATYCTLPCKYSCKLKIFACAGKRVPGYNWSYPFVDVFASGDRRSTACPIMFPPDRVSFGGVAVNAPRQIHEHLSREFGTRFMSECKANSYNHATEQRKSNVGKEAVVPCAAVLAQCGPYNNMTAWRRKVQVPPPRFRREATTRRHCAEEDYRYPDGGYPLFGDKFDDENYSDNV